MTSKRRMLVIALALLIATAAGVAAWRWLDREDTRLAAAVALAPEGSERLGWTDWRAVRAELDADVAAGSTAAEVDELMNAGYSADLTSTSALGISTPTLHAEYGVSPANLEWELLAQGPEGQVILMGLPDELDLDDLADTLRGLGYEETGGVWIAPVTTFADLGTLTPELANLRIDHDERVLVASDDAAFLGQWPDVQRGGDVDDGIHDVVAALDEPQAVSAALYSGDHVCGALAMSQADSSDQALADQLIADAGEVHPMRGFGLATVAGGSSRVAMAFETEEQARADADSRAVLAAGPAPGQGGDFSDRFELGEVTADGRVVRMVLEPVEGAAVLSDLSSGPVLFATC